MSKVTQLGSVSSITGKRKNKCRWRFLSVRTVHTHSPFPFRELCEGRALLTSPHRARQRPRKRRPAAHTAGTARSGGCAQRPGPSAGGPPAALPGPTLARVRAPGAPGGWCRQWSPPSRELHGQESSQLPGPRIRPPGPRLPRGGPRAEPTAKRHSRTSPRRGHTFPAGRPAASSKTTLPRRLRGRARLARTAAWAF